MSDIDANHFGVLLEQIVDQNKALLEAVGDIQQKVARLDGIERDVVELKQDMKVVKAAVVDSSRDLAEHKRLSTHVAHGHV
jgi:hypothetical protein